MHLGGSLTRSARRSGLGVTPRIRGVLNDGTVALKRVPRKTQHLRTLLITPQAVSYTHHNHTNSSQGAHPSPPSTAALHQQRSARIRPQPLSTMSRGLKLYLDFRCCQPPIME